MKKIRPFVIGLLIGALLTISISSFAVEYFQFIKSENVLYVEGQKISLPMYNYQYTNYVPLRAVAETLGLDVSVTGTRIDITRKQKAQGVIDMTEESNKYVTKKELAKFFVESLNPDNRNTDADIIDVDKNDAYYDYVAIAVNNGYLACPKGRFNPDALISRQQYAGYLCNVLNRLSDEYTPNGIPDIRFANEMYIPSIEIVVSLGLMDLYEDGTFRPNELLEMDFTPNPELQKYIKQ